MDYKRQHYVEANYLRGFSKDESTFDIYLLKQGCVLRQKPIREQCQEDWYYEKGGELEKILSKIEEIMAKFRKDVGSLPALFYQSTGLSPRQMQT